MSQHSEQEKQLKDNGFWIHREARHGCIYTDGYSFVMLPRDSRTSDHRALLNFNAQVRRAVLKREVEEKKIKREVVEVEKFMFDKREPKYNVPAFKQPIASIIATKGELPPPPPDKPVGERPPSSNLRPFQKGHVQIRLPTDQRILIRKRITELRLNEHKRSHEIAEILNKEGFTAHGKPCSSHFVQSQILMINIQREKMGMLRLPYFAGPGGGRIQIPTEEKARPITAQGKKLYPKTTPPALDTTFKTKGLDAFIGEPKNYESDKWEEPLPNQPELPQVEVLAPEVPAVSPTPVPPPRNQVARFEAAKKSIPDAVTSILNNTTLDDERKVKMLLWWAEEAMDKLGELIINVLTEPQFKAKTKLKMLMELL